jgi:serine/threonine-protein kinase
MAVVYRAAHRNGAKVAIKVLHPELAKDEELRSRFLREGYIANRVDHAGAVNVLDDDFDDASGLAFIVMELLRGETVEQRRERRGGRLPPAEVLSVGYGVADVLRAAHEEGIVHRDIKPENLFLTTSGQLKVLDFGIARLRELSAPAVSTLYGTSLGTPAFMAPEQARGASTDVGPWSDVYGLGATLFLLASGEPVHTGRTVAEQLIAVAMQPARSLLEVAPEVGQPLAAIVDRALAFEPSARFDGMHEMLSALGREPAEAHEAGLPRTSLLDIDSDPGDRQAAAKLARELLVQRTQFQLDETLDAPTARPLPQRAISRTALSNVSHVSSNERQEVPLSRVGRVNLLGQAADEILENGGPEAAEAILSSHLRRLVLRSKRQGVPLDLHDWATRYALKLAVGTHRGTWFDYVVELHTAAQQPLSLDTIEELFLALRAVDSVRDTLIEEHADWLRGIHGDSPETRVVLERLEGLIRSATLKRSDKPTQ